MTIRQAQQIARSLGITVRRTGYGQELRVALSGRGNEPSAYYTDCPEDAAATALHMHTHQTGQPHGPLTPPAPVA
jgi:hypothetical protein